MIIATVVGNLGKDAVERIVKGRNGSPDQTVISFSVASSEKVGDETITTWVDVSYWRKSRVVDYLKKGGKVAAAGKLGTRTHEGKTYLTLRADHVELLGDGKAKEGGGRGARDEYDQRHPDPSASGPSYEDDIPF